jgi:hypothetical protein
MNCLIQVVSIKDMKHASDLIEGSFFLGGGGEDIRRTPERTLGHPSILIFLDTLYFWFDCRYTLEGAKSLIVKVLEFASSFRCSWR